MASIAPATSDDDRTREAPRIRTYGSPWLAMVQGLRRRNRLKTLKKDREERRRNNH